jgi:hypothetical protein
MQMTPLDHEWLIQLQQVAFKALSLCRIFFRAVDSFYLMTINQREIQMSHE